MASSGTLADLLATRLRTLEPFALRAIAEAQVAAARAPIAQLQAHRAIAEPFALRAIAEAQEVIAAARAPIAQLEAQPRAAGRRAHARDAARRAISTAIARASRSKRGRRARGRRADQGRGTTTPSMR